MKKRLSLGLIIIGLLFSCTKQGKEIEFLNQVDGKIVKVLASMDENNQPKEFNWAISINKDYLDSVSFPIDNFILAPNNLSDIYKIPNLRIKVSGNKYITKNHALTSPNLRSGFGYLFEITDITTILK